MVISVGSQFSQPYVPREFFYESRESFDGASEIVIPASVKKRDGVISPFTSEAAKLLRALLVRWPPHQPPVKRESTAKQREADPAEEFKASVGPRT